MVHWILVGVSAVVLTVAVFGAPQLPDSQQNQGPTVGFRSGKPTIYRSKSQNETRDLFAYPEEQFSNNHNQDAKNRTPVYIPNWCQKNEILYPSDEGNDWVCDCKPTFVYHPPSRQCYQLFTKAFCEDGYMVTLPNPDSKQPKCVFNPCYKRNVNLVLFNNECVELNAYYVKCSIDKLRLIVAVQENNMLGCVHISVNPYNKIDSF
ncbi:uncharacterized protein LOC109402412 [Aedes albopictus]|uniref:DUF4789 domain-containing protein n=1 Tax=Aedes albopictus TaxID=7160 RepID=A0ABM1Z9A7_AEDAL|nr:uncharacterized protein LOC109402412 [Aedes albopictus]